MDYFVHEKALVEEGSIIGADTRVWAFAHIQQGVRIGRGCNICDGSFVERGAVIGDAVTIKHHVAIFDGVTIGHDVFVGSNVAFINDQHPRSRQPDWVLVKTEVQQGASIGANACILGGVTIGAYAMIGAGAVVTKDVPAHALVVGNPGVVKGFVCVCARGTDASGKCACGRRYKQTAKGVSFDV